MRKLLALIFLAALSCQKEPSRNPVKVIYNAGSTQESRRSQNDLYRLMRQKSKIDDYKICFSDLSKYVLNYPNGQPYDGWNKILGTYKCCGANFGIHENSSRLAWRYDRENDFFEGAIYKYNGGRRSWQIIDTVKAGECVYFDNFELKYAVRLTAAAGAYKMPNDVIITVE